MERQFTIHAAKINLSKLIEAALAGDDVVITKGKKPVARLVAIPTAKFKIGVLKDRITDPAPDFFEPLGDRFPAVGISSAPSTDKQKPRPG